MLFKTKRFDKPNAEQIKSMVEFHREQLTRLIKLENHYKGQHDILNRVNQISNNANNKAMTNFCKLITDTLTAYVVSKPIEYKADDKALEVITKYNKINDSRDEDYELLKIASIFGTAYEVMYFDEVGELRFNECSPLNTMLIYDVDSIEDKAIAGMRIKTIVDGDTKKSFIILQVYTDTTVFTFTLNDKLNVLAEEEEQHYFKSLPIYELVNNAERQGDFEQVIPLQDSYNLAISDWSNNIQNVVNALLVFTNYNMEQDEETLRFMSRLKETGCISIDSDGDVKYIASNLDSTSVKDLLETLKEDIHKISCCPNMSDEKFGANASGIAMKYKLYNTEQVAGAKERKMYKLLQNRLRLISDSPKTAQFDWLNVEFVFKRNIPVNETELTESLVKLKGIISDESLFSMMKFLGIENAKDELERVENENKVNIEYLSE